MSLADPVAPPVTAAAATESTVPSAERPEITAVDLVRAGLVAVIAALCGLEFHRAFGLGPLLVPVIGAAAGAALVSVLGRRLSSRAAVGVVLSIVGMVVLSAALVFGDVAAAHLLPTPGALGDLWDGLVNGWARLITTALPVDDQPDLLVVPFALTWVASAAGVELVLRTRARLAAALPSLAVFVVAVTAGIGGVGSQHLIPLLLVLALAALASVGTRPRSVDQTGEVTRRAGRTIAGLLVAVLAVAVLAALVGPGAPGTAARSPYDPRETAEADVVDRESVNPLALLASWGDQPGERLFAARASKPVRWRLAVLDRWDGTDWTADERFVSVGSVLPEPVRGSGGLAADLVVQSVTIEGLDTAWLPVADRPTEVRGADVLLEPVSSVVLAPGGSAAVGTYRAVSEVMRPEPSRFNTAASGAASSTAGAVPGLPAVIGALAARVTTSANATSPYQRALLLERYLHTRFTFDRKARSGHSYPRILDLLGYPLDGDGPRGKPTSGTSEQFATAFALMARSLGIPTRVVVGFHAGRELGGGRYSVRGGDAFAWPEIQLQGYGWVPLDPTPQEEGTPPPPEQQQRQEIEQNAEKDALVDLAQDPSKAPDPATPGGGAPTPDPAARNWWPVVAVGSVLLLAAAYVTVVVLARRRRRSRRRSGSPEQQVIGAWEEMLDVMGEGGARPAPSATTAEVVDLASVAVPHEAAACVADARELVVAAAYAPAALGDDAARSAWILADRFEASVSASLRPQERLLRRLDPHLLIPAEPRRR